MKLRHLKQLLIISSAVAFVGGCDNREAKSENSIEAGTPILTKVNFQLDWYPAPEHGGHFQALVKGYYREGGLDVTILAGGPGAFGIQSVATGKTAFAMGREDDIIRAVAQGLPLLIIGAQMQHDPQGIMFHADSTIQSLKDLDGRSVMANPGSSWIEFIKKKYSINFNIIPLNYGMAQFMGDKNFIQQCFISNEPYHAELNGVATRAILIADGGYDPYRVYFTNKNFARQNSELVRAFVAASNRGWHEFLHHDVPEARAAIAKENPSQTPALMDYSIKAMKRYKLIEGDPDRGERIGKLSRERMINQGKLLVELGILNEIMPLENYVSFDFLPPELRDDNTISASTTNTQ